MNTYKGKAFSVLGDSISTLFGYSTPEDAVYYSASRRYETGVCYLRDTWWGRVIEALGGRLLINNSFSGSTVCRYSESEYDSYACSDGRTSALSEGGCAPDVIMIFMGINDRGCGAMVYPLCKGGESDLSVFSSAYDTMLGKVRKNYPSAEVWCLTLPLGLCDGYPPSDDARRSTEEYSAVISECALKHGCRLIDICAMKPYDSADGVHPSSDGMKAIADAVLSNI